MDHHGPPGDVPLPAVPEGDAAVHQGDEGDGGALEGEDVAQVPGVPGERPGAGVLLLVRVEVAPGRLAVVPGVSGHVNVEAVVAGAQAEDLSLDEDSVGSLLQEEGPGNVDISSSGQQLNHFICEIFSVESYEIFSDHKPAWDGSPCTWYLQ